MADPKTWFRRINDASAAVISAAYDSGISVDTYLADNGIVAAYFAIPTSEGRRGDIVAQDVIDAGRILLELKAWLDADDGASGILRRARLLKMLGPS
jgi:hypothetical protein